MFLTSLPDWAGSSLRSEKNLVHLCFSSIQGGFAFEWANPWRRWRLQEQWTHHHPVLCRLCRHCFPSGFLDSDINVGAAVSLLNPKGKILVCPREPRPARDLIFIQKVAYLHFQRTEIASHRPKRVCFPGALWECICQQQVPWLFSGCS